MSTNLALAKITGTGRTAGRTFGARVQDIFNVKDFGAKGDFSTNDTAAIQDCMDACGTAVGSDSIGGTVFFPPGGYNVNASLDISGVGYNSRIIGSGRSATFISGNLPNGFIFTQGVGGAGNGPSEIAHLALSNTNTNIGTGALCVANGSAHIHDCSFIGMFGVLLPFNIYDMIIEECTVVCNQHLIAGVPRTGNGYNGTVMIGGYAPHIFGFRSTGPAMTGIQLQGVNTTALIGNGIENCEVGMLLGVYTGWASHCTTSGTTLTVMGSGSGGIVAPDGEHYFQGAQVWGTGFTLKPWFTDPMDPDQDGTWIIATLTGSGDAGTYQLNRAPPVDITTPVPIWTRATRSISGATVACFQNEACWIGLYANSIGASNIMSVGGNSAIGETVDQWGAVGSLPHSGLWIQSAGGTQFSGCGGTNNQTVGSFYIAPGNTNTHTTFTACTGGSGTDNSVTAKIDGTILTVTALLSGPGFGRNIKVDPTGAAGVSAGTYITGSKASELPTKALTSVTAASPAVVTSALAHGYVATDGIQFVQMIGSETLPTGLSFLTTYFVIAAGLTSTQFRVSATSGGSAINTTGSASTGTLYVVKADGTDGLSGYNALGTFRVNNSQTVASTTMSLPYGPGWYLPPTSGAGTGLKFDNCRGTGLTHSTLFTYLPGQAGAASIPAVEGDEYSITDGAKSGGGTAVFGDATQGGGSQHIKVWWNGTSWIRNG